MKLTRYGMQNGLRFGEKVQEMSALAACAEVVRFIFSGMISALIDGTTNSVTFWREGAMNEEFVEFEGSAEEIADIGKIFRFANDNAELRDQLQQHLCCDELPRMLWMRTSESMMRGPSYGALVLMFMAGIKDVHEYTHTSGVAHDMGILLAALELWQYERDAGRETSLSSIMQPPAKAA